MTVTETLYIPDTLVNWPWPRAINQHYKEVDAESSAWFRSFKIFTPESQYAFDKCNFGLLAALAYPWVSKDHLRTGCDMMFLVFAIDEYTDVESAVVVREMVDSVIDAMKNPSKPRPEGEVVLGEITRQFWELAIKTASPSAQRHMIESFIDYLESVVEQARDRDNNTSRSIWSYIKSRRENVATRSSCVVLELGMDLPDEVFYHPVMIELSEYISDMSMIDNDICSYSKERAVGDEVFNILSVVMRQLNTTLDGAVQWAKGYHANLVTKYMDSLKRLPSWGPTIDDQVQKYLYGLAHWHRGTVCWYFESGRYFGDKGLEYQRTRLVPLLPKATPYKENASNRRERVVVPLIEALEAKA